MSFRVGIILLCTMLVNATHAADVLFHWFEYTGKDSIFAVSENEGQGQYQNPIIAGSFSDPSITRSEDTFYMVHSSYAYAPGIPLLKSTDLVNWEFVGHVLTRPSQLKLQGASVSRGIWAPTIRYHDGVFYVITTGLDNAGGTFMVTATDPEGEWSDPIYLPEIKGVHPDIFFDDGGKAYITHSGSPAGKQLYNGHRAIWLWEFDTKKQKVIAESGRIIINGGSDISKKPLWVEGPHIYKKGDWYYLLCAEGGTGDWHAEVVFRAKSLQEPFVPYYQNPILTQRQLATERPNPIINAGHADLVKTPKGEWWAVFLGSRSYGRGHFNTGRETYLLPVKWLDEWPVILASGEPVPHRAAVPQGLIPTENATPFTGNFTWRDAFDKGLQPQWSLLRVAETLPYRFISGGGLTLEPRAFNLAGNDQPSLIVRRQQHQNFIAETALQIPGVTDILAGMVAFYDERSHFFLAVRRTGKTTLELTLERAKQASPEIVSRLQVNIKAETKKIILGIESESDRLGFYMKNIDQTKNYISKQEDAKILSTKMAGGFVGTQLGIHVRQLIE